MVSNNQEIQSRRNFLNKTFLTVGLFPFIRSSLANTGESSSLALYEKSNLVDNFNSNVNPLGCSPKLNHALNNVPFAFSDYSMADFYSQMLVKELQDQYKLKKTSVFLGPGSRVLAYMLLAGLKKNGSKRLLMPELDYEVVMLFAKELGLNGKEIPTLFNSNAEIDFARLESEIRPDDIVYLSNPNMPTGYISDPEKLLRLIRKKPQTFFIIDEAYIHFLGKDYLKKSLIQQSGVNNNLAILRTYSKIYGLAAMRVGYIVSNEENINKYLPKYHKFRIMNALGPFLAIEAMKDLDFLEKTRTEMQNKGKIVKTELTTNGWNSSKEGLNYILFWKKIPSNKVSTLKSFKSKKLKEKTGVSIYSLDSYTYMITTFCIPKEIHFSDRINSFRSAMNEVNLLM